MAMQRCDVCGEPLEQVNCSLCHGTGTDLDMNNGAGGTCEACDGSGEVWICAKWDAFHDEMTSRFPDPQA